MVQAFSIGKDVRKDVSQSPMVKLVPGPGTYDSVNNTMKDAPKWAFGSGKRPAMTLRQGDVGPGQYQIPQRAVEGSQYTMGAINHKIKKYGSVSPGPGAYAPQAKGNETSLSYSMGAKFESVLTNKEGMKLPGAGTYDPKPVYKGYGDTKFGSSQRAGIYDVRKAKFVPSPFQYKQDAGFVQRTAPNFSFGSEKQRPNTSKATLLAPGPGHYPIKQLVGNESVGKTLSQKLCPAFEKPGANKVPGPGTYGGDYRQTKSKEPHWRIGTSTRDDKEKTMRRTCNYPPPDTYNPVYTTVKSQSAVWGFGSSKRGNLTVGRNEAPSMQSYNIPSKAIEGKTWFMGLKLGNQGAINGDKSKWIPGPGNYNPDYTSGVQAKPSYSMKGRYMEQKKLNVPGPGTYQRSLVDKKSAPQYGFGSSPQRMPTKKTLGTGPGGYHIPAMIADVPSYSMPGESKYKYI